MKTIIALLFLSLCFLGCKKKDSGSSGSTTAGAEAGAGSTTAGAEAGAGSAKSLCTHAKEWLYYYKGWFFLNQLP